jgi:hypothetical protein
MSCVRSDFTRASVRVRRARALLCGAIARRDLHTRVFENHIRGRRQRRARDGSCRVTHDTATGDDDDDDDDDDARRRRRRRR